MSVWTFRSTNWAAKTALMLVKCFIWMFKHVHWYQGRKQLSSGEIVKMENVPPARCTHPAKYKHMKSQPGYSRFCTDECTSMGSLRLEQGPTWIVYCFRYTQCSHSQNQGTSDIHTAHVKSTIQIAVPSKPCKMGCNSMISRSMLYHLKLLMLHSWYPT